MTKSFIMSPLPLFVDGDLVVFRCVVQKEKHLTAVDGRGLKMADCMYKTFLEGSFPVVLIVIPNLQNIKDTMV